jgi:RNA polymerase sigma-70 factor, ECF subfamily
VATISWADTVSDPLADLVARAQHGDRVALGELIHETQGRVYNLAYRMLGNPQEAEDLTQEIFVRMWRALPHFRGDSKFTTWLHTIATNACLNRKRSLRRQLETELDAQDALETLPSQDHGPVQGVLEEDERTRLWEMVERLPEKYRLVLALFYQQQLSYQEIAQVLTLPLGTVKAHLNRARSALGASLEKVGIR